MKEFYVRYIGNDAADLRFEEIYRAHRLKDSTKFIGVLDRSGEWYAYPASIFELLDNDTTDTEAVDKRKQE